MKGFLFDQNLPSRIEFKPSLPVHHVTEIHAQPTDTEIWLHAKRHEFAIVSKDTDFFHRIIAAEPPPWVVHLKVGNLRRRDFHRFLAGIWPKIEAALPRHKLVTVYADHMEVVSG
jgi:predicted nuclease of predicted toxin-antitoxin system